MCSIFILRKYNIIWIRSRSYNMLKTLTMIRIPLTEIHLQNTTGNSWGNIVHLWKSKYSSCWYFHVDHFRHLYCFNLSQIAGSNNETSELPLSCEYRYLCTRVYVYISLMQCCHTHELNTLSICIYGSNYVLWEHRKTYKVYRFSMKCEYHLNHQTRKR